MSTVTTNANTNANVLDDGKMASVSFLLSGNATDEFGNKLVFEPVNNSNYDFVARTLIPDGSGRIAEFRFHIPDSTVPVSKRVLSGGSAGGEVSSSSSRRK